MLSGVCKLEIRFKNSNSELKHAVFVFILQSEPMLSSHSQRDSKKTSLTHNAKFTCFSAVGLFDIVA